MRDYALGKQRGRASRHGGTPSPPQLFVNDIIPQEREAGLMHVPCAGALGLPCIGTIKEIEPSFVLRKVVRNFRRRRQEPQLLMLRQILFYREGIT